MVLNHQSEHPSQWSTDNSIAEKIGCSGETLRHWMRQSTPSTVERNPTRGYSSCRAPASRRLSERTMQYTRTEIEEKVREAGIELQVFSARSPEDSSSHSDTMSKGAQKHSRF